MHEDVPGIVVEPGSRTTRLGVAGELAPAIIAPSAVLREPSSMRYRIPVRAPPTPEAEVWTPVVDGVIHDPETAVAAWEYHSQSRLGMPLSEQPLTVTEEVWNPVEARRRLLEIAFEGVGVPVFQLAKAPLAVAFGSAKTNALVVSVGAAMASAVPVVDGIVRSKAATHTRFAGDFVDAHVLQQLENMPAGIAPHYQVSIKQAGLETGQAASLDNLKPAGSDSFHSYQMSRLIDEFKRVCCVASPTPLQGPEIRGTRLYEFPSGLNLFVGPERLTAVEALFQPTMTPLPDGSVPGLNSFGLSEAVYQTLQKVDAPPEVVLSLVTNVLLHGGTAQTAGLPLRLERDLTTLMPNTVPKVHRVGGHPAWTGASILASIGVYDESTWTTRQKYEEVGANALASEA